MNNEVEITNVSANRDANSNGAAEGLDAEVRNINKKKTDGSDAIPDVTESGNSSQASEDLASRKKLWAQIAKFGVQNADNAGLNPTRLCGMMEGCVVDVNGGLAEEVQGFLPTYDELMQLVKYWTKTDLDIQLFEFRFRTTGSTEWRRATFAGRRIARIENLIGKDLVEMAQEEAYAEVGKEQDPREWDIFLNGTEEQRKDLQKEIARKMQMECVDEATSETTSIQCAISSQAGTEHESSQQQR